MSSESARPTAPATRGQEAGGEGGRLLPKSYGAPPASASCGGLVPAAGGPDAVNAEAGPARGFLSSHEMEMLEITSGRKTRGWARSWLLVFTRNGNVRNHEWREDKKCAECSMCDRHCLCLLSLLARRHLQIVGMELGAKAARTCRGPTEHPLLLRVVVASPPWLAQAVAIGLHQRGPETLRPLLGLRPQGPDTLRHWK